MKAKPCPFCGCEAEIRAIKNTNPQIGFQFNIRCTDPTCMGRTQKWYVDKDEAISLWNKRKEYNHG